MPLMQTDANPASSTVNNVSSPATSGGNQTQKTQEQMLAEYKAENERKQEKIDDLNGRLEDVQSEIQRLTQLVEAGDATRAQQLQLQNLGGAQQDIESQLVFLENDPKNKLGYLSIDRRIEKRVKEAEVAGEHQALYRLQVGLIEDTAEEMGLKEEDLIKQLKPLAFQFQFDANGDQRNVYRKTQLAIRALKRNQEIAKAESERKKKEAEAAQSRENGTAGVRQAGTLEDAIAKKDIAGQMRNLGL